MISHDHWWLVVSSVQNSVERRMSRAEFEMESLYGDPRNRCLCHLSPWGKWLNPWDLQTSAAWQPQFTIVYISKNNNVDKTPIWKWCITPDLQPIKMVIWCDDWGMVYDCVFHIRTLFFWIFCGCFSLHRPAWISPSSDCDRKLGEKLRKAPSCTILQLWPSTVISGFIIIYNQLVVKVM